MIKTFYDLLEIPQDATLEEIKSAAKAKLYANHPDREPDPIKKQEKEEITKNINNAYYILENPLTRKMYDEELPKKSDTLFAQIVRERFLDINLRNK